jgi:hypothetical protein
MDRPTKVVNFLDIDELNVPEWTLGVSEEDVKENQSL